MITMFPVVLHVKLLIDLSGSMQIFGWIFFSSSCVERLQETICDLTSHSGESAVIFLCLGLREWNRAIYHSFWAKDTCRKVILRWRHEAGGKQPALHPRYHPSTELLMQSNFWTAHERVSTRNLRVDGVVDLHKKLSLCLCLALRRSIIIYLFGRKVCIIATVSPAVEMDCFNRQLPLCCIITVQLGFCRKEDKSPWSHNDPSGKLEISDWNTQQS